MKTTHFDLLGLKIVELSGKVVVGDETIIADVEELARALKAIKYIDELLSGIDPDLLPLATWDNFKAQADACLSQMRAFEQSRGINHLQQANAHLDNLLNYVRPYMVVGGRTARSMQAALREYNKAIERTSLSYQKRANEGLVKINELSKNAEQSKSTIDEIEKRISDLGKEYFESTDDDKSLTMKVAGLREDAQLLFDTIQKYHQLLTTGSEEEAAISDEISKARGDASKNTTEIKEMLKTSREQLTELGEFHNNVFGELEEDGERSGGLRKELHDRQSDLNVFSKTQREQHEALKSNIESLLPGATSAGLASAYLELKDSYDTSIRFYSGMFFVSIASMILFAPIFAISKVGWLFIEFESIASFKELGSNVLLKGPLFAPIIWLAYFASKRRSESQRLQQEYAHKEALARSYQGYKKQIDELPEQDQELMVKLLDTAITAVAFNASSTLDGKHGDKAPVYVAAEKIVPGLGSS